MAHKTGTIDKSGLSPEVQAYIDGLEGQNADLAKTLGEATDTIEALSKSDDETEDDDDTNEDVETLLKSADPRLAEIVKSAQAQAALATKAAEEATKIAKSERDTRQIAESVAKAASLDSIGADSAKLGLALKTIVEKAGQEAHDVVWAALTSANEVAKTANVLGEVGTGGEGRATDDASSEITKRANAMIAKGEAKTYGEAVAAVVAADPNLYTEHRSNINKGA